MHLIVYYPEADNAERELKKMVASIHANAVIDYIDRCPLHKKDKIRMIDEIISLTNSKSR